MLDGRFEILQLLGQGGFSKVYRVRDDVEGAERALKLFESAAGDEAVRREIGALRKIDHPNVVKVFWAGKTNAGDWYLITEFIDGESLDEFVSGKRRLRDREAVDVALDLLAALVAFHPDAARLQQLEAERRDGELPEAEAREWRELQDKGLVHRDIKPLNVMLTRTGAKLLDFNIASRVGDPVHTQSGTPPYQPPDASLDHWDVSVDLFAVGVLLYRLLCDGHHPFPHAMPVAGAPVTDPRAIRSDLNPDLAGFLLGHARRSALSASPRLPTCGSPCVISALTFDQPGRPVVRAGPQRPVRKTADRPALRRGGERRAGRARRERHGARTRRTPTGTPSVTVDNLAVGLRRPCRGRRLVRQPRAKPSAALTASSRSAPWPALGRWQRPAAGTTARSAKDRINAERAVL